jgi:hypothetical protein
MDTISVPKGRASVSTEFDGMQIVIPARKRIFVLLFLPVWLVGWAFGEVTAIRGLGDAHVNDNGFLAFWLLGWSVGGAFALFALLWNLAGREILRFGSGVFAYRRAIGALGYTKRYELSQVRDLRAVPAPAWGSRNGANTWGLTGGQIAFDYGSSTVNVGNGVDEAEAKDLVEQVKRRYRV